MKEMRIVFSDDLFYRNFRHLKAQYCLSRMAMSKLLGISIYTVEALEKNTCFRGFPWPALQRMSQVFDVPVETLLQKDISAEE